jgi:hypothetical protein
VTRESASDGRRKRTARAALCVAAVVGVALVGAPEFVGASEGDAVPGFSGSAAASGIRFTMKSTNIPLTDTPAEGGGPTAQVVVESAGTSQGYAAMPDPGPIVIGGPSLLAGVLAGGVPGVVPPTKLPQEPPGYPFYVHSDAGSAPEANLSHGPMQMSAASTQGASKASASAGLQAPGGINAGLATSNVEIAPSGGTVVAKAVTRAEGVTVGPLTIGAVTSVATQTLDASGKVTPSTQLQIDGVAVNGQSFGLTPDGFGGGGSTVPVPLNPTLESVLKASGISVRFVAPQTYPNRVVAPVLEVTMPFDSGSIPALGQYKGTLTLTMGFATAAMTPAPGLDTSLTEPIADTFSPVLSDPAPGEAADIGAAPPVDASNGALTSDGSSGEAAFSLPGDSAGTGGSIGLSEPREPAGSEGTLQPSTSPPPSEVAAGESVTGSLATAGGSSPVDVRGIYLIGVLAAATALAGGEAMRRFGRLT